MKRYHYKAIWLSTDGTALHDQPSWERSSQEVADNIACEYAIVAVRNRDNIIKVTVSRADGTLLGHAERMGDTAYFFDAPKPTTTDHESDAWAAFAHQPDKE